MPTRPYLLFALFCLASCMPYAEEKQPPRFPKGTWVDLSHAFDETTIYWPTADGFRLDTVFEGTTDSGFYYSAYNYCAAEHGGTHLDAPVHFAEGRLPMDQLPLEQLIGQAVVVDVSAQAASQPDYRVTTADFQAWESANGPLPEGVIVLLRTGYGKFWPDRKRYMGTDERGTAAVAKLHFPGLHPDAARWLLANRKIKAIGLDTPSIDYGQSTLFETHRTLFDKNVPAFENLANLDQLPLKNFGIVALPMKIRNGSGGPLRIVAMLPR